jgi:hypothetical protein
VDLVIPTGGLEGILKKDDVITSIDGHPIQEDATAAFRTHEFTNAEYYVQLHQMGEKVALELICNGKRMQVEAPLLKKADDLLLIKTYQYDRMPRYVVLGGYVFAPLTRNLAVQVARSHIDLIPFVNDFVSKERKEVVLLLRVLPSALSRGDYSYLYWPIEKIDGKRFSDFDTFYRLLKEGKDPMIVLENKMGQRVVIDRKRAMELQEEILKKYNIEFGRSEDMR